MSREQKVFMAVFILGTALFISGACYISAYYVYRETVPGVPYSPPLFIAEFLPYIGFALSYYSSLRLAKAAGLGLTKNNLYLKALLFFGILVAFYGITFYPVQFYAKHFNPFM